jgi:hypothetical protein
MKSLDSLTTHYIVCKTPSERDIAHLKSLPSLPLIVKHLWLAECCRQKKAVIEDEFLVEIEDTKEKENTKSRVISNITEERDIIRAKEGLNLTTPKTLFRDYVFYIDLFSPAEVLLSNIRIAL